MGFKPESDVSNYLEIVECIYRDATTKCSADVSDERDLLTIRSRVEQEGLSFLTITLPNYCKDFERSLANGCIDPTSFRGFKRVRKGAIPELFQGMLGRLFDVETGRLFSHEDSPNGDTSDVHTLIESVRQLCLTFKKVELLCTPEREHRALENFKKIEREFEEFSLPARELDRFRSVSALLWSGMLYGFSPADVTPKHGPGSTAERIAGNSKYVWQRWYERLEPFFPLIGFGYPMGIVSNLEEIEKVTFVLPEDETAVRVVFVPKTLKSPRVIAMEPVCMQYAQQSLRDYLYSRLESWSLSAGHLNFSDQSINQALALTSSFDQRLATIDMSDASDRVPLSLVEYMLECNPLFRDCVLACRSTSAQLPTGEIISPLRKFASMGSALCFPIEAMYFYTICVVSLLDAYNLPLTPGNLFKVTRDIYVYGDDILVPTAYAELVLDRLQKYNCKPNTAKTFVVGYFRESCGVDAYYGKAVQPVYLRHPLPEYKRQASEIASAVETSNHFYQKGYWATASLIRKRIDQIIRPLPYRAANTEGLGYLSAMGYRSVERWNESLHRFEVRTYVVSPTHRTDVIEGYPALAKSLLNLEARKSNEGEGAMLDVSIRRGAVALKLRWVPA